MEGIIGRVVKDLATNELLFVVSTTNMIGDYDGLPHPALVCANKSGSLSTYSLQEVILLLSDDEEEQLSK